MINFSPAKQAFYDTTLSYPELPSDLIEVSVEQHYELLGKFNLGCIIFADLTASPLRPSQFHEWDGLDWVDNRTDAEKRAAYLASLPNLSKRQFNLYLYDNQKLDDVNNLLANNPRFKIEFDSTDTIVCTSSTVDAMITLLGWTDEQVDSMWEEALTL